MFKRPKLNCSLQSFGTQNFKILRLGQCPNTDYNLRHFQIPIIIYNEHISFFHCFHATFVLCCPMTQIPK